MTPDHVDALLKTLSPIVPTLAAAASGVGRAFVGRAGGEAWDRLSAFVGRLRDHADRSPDVRDAIDKAAAPSPPIDAAEHFRQQLRALLSSDADLARLAQALTEP